MTKDDKAGEKVEIQIGDYWISKYERKDAIWIEHKSGEGMQITADHFDRIYKENF